jgi:hypothetical protein
MASPLVNRVLAGAAGLVAARATRTVLRRVAPRVAGGPILGPLVFFLASRYALPRVRRLTRDWATRRLEERAARRLAARVSAARSTRPPGARAR